MKTCGLLFSLLCVEIIANSGKHTIVAEKCPSSRAMYACYCDENNIVCGGKQKYNLKHVFLELSRNLVNNEKHFQDFIFENTAIEELDDNTFCDITFKNITIQNALNLAKIKSSAFNNTAKRVQIFSQTGESKLGKKYINQLFDSLSSLVNVRHITLELNHLKTFPSHAFRNINGKQAKLETIIIHSKSITKISNYVFYELPNLKCVKFVANTISWISAHSFDFEMPSNHMINIDLQSNHIDERVFELDSFLDTKRPIHLMLMRNRLRFLNETIFSPILNIDSRNIIDLSGNQLKCNDCNMYWIIRDRDTIGHQLKNAICNNLADIMTVDETYFNDCKTNRNYAPLLVIKSMSFKDYNIANNIALLISLSLLFVTVLTHY